MAKWQAWGLFCTYNGTFDRRKSSELAYRWRLTPPSPHNMSPEYVPIRRAPRQACSIVRPNASGDAIYAPCGLLRPYSRKWQMAVGPDRVVGNVDRGASREVDNICNRLQHPFAFPYVTYAFYILPISIPLRSCEMEHHRKSRICTVGPPIQLSETSIAVPVATSTAYTTDCGIRSQFHAGQNLILL